VTAPPPPHRPCSCTWRRSTPDRSRTAPARTTCRPDSAGNPRTRRPHTRSWRATRGNSLDGLGVQPFAPHHPLPRTVHLVNRDDPIPGPALLDLHPLPTHRRKRKPLRDVPQHGMPCSVALWPLDRPGGGPALRAGPPPLEFGHFCTPTACGRISPRATPWEDRRLILTRPARAGAVASVPKSGASPLVQKRPGMARGSWR
jgi:hypothetical protein